MCLVLKANFFSLFKLSVQSKNTVYCLNLQIIKKNKQEQYWPRYWFLNECMEVITQKNIKYSCKEKVYIDRKIVDNFCAQTNIDTHVWKTLQLMSKFSSAYKPKTYKYSIKKL